MAFTLPSAALASFTIPAMVSPEGITTSPFTSTGATREALNGWTVVTSLVILSFRRRASSVPAGIAPAKSGRVKSADRRDSLIYLAIP